MCDGLDIVQRWRSLLCYEPETGRFSWRPRTAQQFPGAKNPESAAAAFNARFAGREALTASGLKSARYGLIDRKPVKAARVAWALSYGRLPKGDVIHRNGDLADNRLENLASAKRGQGPRGVRSDSRSESKGVSRNGRRWVARLRLQGKLRHLGTFGTKAEAVAAVQAAERARKA